MNQTLQIARDEADAVEMVIGAHEALSDVQSRLKAPKDKSNDFGGYNYRTAEAILAAVKPLLPKGSDIVLSDAPAEVAGQLVLIARATFTYRGRSISADSFALHSLQKKGMDAAQISGSASSYARKYALSGLLAIDDSAGDPDGHDNTKQNGTGLDQTVLDSIAAAKDADTLKSIWEGNQSYQELAEFRDAINKRKKSLPKPVEVKQESKPIIDDEIPY